MSLGKLKACRRLFSLEENDSVFLIPVLVVQNTARYIQRSDE